MLAAISDLAAILNVFLVIFRFVTGHQSIQYMKNTLYPIFFTFCMILDIWSCRLM